VHNAVVATISRLESSYDYLVELSQLTH